MINEAAVEYAGVGHFEAYVKATNPGQISTLQKVIFASQWCYEIGVMFPKLSVLALYLRIFSTRETRMATHILQVIVVLIPIALLSASLAQCQPLAYTWDKSIQGGTCFDIPAYYQAMSPPNVATDLAMLILPLPQVWSLDIPRVRKFGVTLVFLMGSLGMVASIARTVVFFDLDLLEDQTRITVWAVGLTIIEPGMYLIAACMIALRPLLSYVIPEGVRSSVSRKIGGSSGKDNTTTLSTISTHARSRKLPSEAGFAGMTPTDTFPRPSVGQTTVTADQATPPTSNGSSMISHRSRENYIQMRTDVWVQPSSAESSPA